MRKLISFAFLALFLFLFCGPLAQAGGGDTPVGNSTEDAGGAIEQKELEEEKVEEQGIRIIVNGREVEFEPSPLVCEDRVKVSARTLLERMGAQVNWEEATRSVVVETEETIVYFRVDDGLTIEVNNEVIETDNLPTIINGVTMLPLELIPELFDYELYWEGEHTVYLESSNYVPFKYLNELDEEEREPLKKWAEDRRREMGAQAKIREGRLYLLVTFGEQFTGGYGVEIRHMEEVPEAFKATVVFEEPSPEHFTTPALSYPYDLVAVDLSEKEAPASIIFHVHGLEEKSRIHFPVKIEPLN